MRPCQYFPSRAVGDSEHRLLFKQLSRLTEADQEFIERPADRAIESGTKIATDVSDAIIDVRTKLFIQTLTALPQDKPEALTYFLGLPENRPTAERLLGRRLDDERDLAPHTVRSIAEQLHEAIRGTMLRPGESEESLPGVRFASGDAFRREYSAALGTPLDRVLSVPSAYRQGNTLHFDPSHPDFLDEAKLTRAVTHELLHVALDAPSVAGLADTLLRRLRRSAAWVELQRLIGSLFANSDAAPGDDWHAVQEIIAIYVAGRRTPYVDPDSPQSQIVNLLDHDQELFEILRPIAERIRVQSPQVERQLKDAVEEQHGKDLLRRDIDAGRLNIVDNRVYTNADEEQQAGKTLINKDIEGKAREMAGPGGLRERVRMIQRRIATVQNNMPRFRQLIDALPSADRLKSQAALDAALDYFAENSTALVQAGNYADALERWPLVPGGGGLPVKDKARWAKKLGLENTEFYQQLLTMNVSSQIASVEAADAASAADREGWKDAIAGGLAEIESPLDSLEQFLAFKDDQPSQSNEPRLSAWQWISRFIQGGNTVTWLSIYDMLKIIKIYKEAIVENYESRQKVRTFDFAKELNLHAPIQETLKKQARAANEEEAHKYHEYLQKEGFTYDDIFKPGGLLDVHRGSNINRAKAVLEYAADHAWLYEFNRDEGADSHNVYGVDYEGVFGKETFRELLQKNAAGKKREDDAGYEKVNLYEDIPLIIRDMEIELEEVNLYRAKGMMRRLQEKAKMAESNTWALTTFVRHLRNSPKLLKVLDIGALDDIGNLGISQAAWSLTLFKTMRDDFKTWKLTGNQQILQTGKKVGPLGRTIRKIEQELQSAGVPMSSRPGQTETIDHLVAKVLAGQTVRVDGKVLSIFEDRFNEYRQYWLTISNTSIEPGKTDDDYYNPVNGGSDMLLLGRLPTESIVSHESQGAFRYASKAPGFYAQMIDRLLELKKDGPADAYRNFRKEMTGKLEGQWQTDLSNGNARSNFKAARDFRGRPIARTLFDEGILSREEFDFINGK